MNRFEELYRLKELEAKASGDQWDSIGESISTSDMVDIDGEGDRYIEIPYNERDAEFIAAFRNASPWLLKIAEAFQPGDSSLLAWMLSDQEFDEADYSGELHEQITNLLRRLQAAAEEMER
jgi:hypothetical protein